MRRIFKVHETAQTIRLTKDLVEEGFDGELEGFMNAVTLTLVKPSTTLDLAIESLRGTIHDIQLRKKAGLGIESSPPQKLNGFDEMRWEIKRKEVSNEDNSKKNQTTML